MTNDIYLNINPAMFEKNYIRIHVGLFNKKQTNLLKRRRKKVVSNFGEATRAVESKGRDIRHSVCYSGPPILLSWPLASSLVLIAFPGS